ncbi:hypothetical protein MKX03_022741 [Papaver bracteatum]|nr:hypothetical protein MKX03_022741 [Papaver bracteatum]
MCTTTSSVKSHDGFGSVDWNITGDMLVCRVIAGRVNEANSTNVSVAAETYDDVGAGQKAYVTYEELFIFNQESIIPCFVVIYTYP